MLKWGGQKAHWQGEKRVGQSSQQENYLQWKVGEGKGSGVSLGVKGGRKRGGSSRWCWLTAWCVDTQMSAGQGCLLQRW